MKKTLLAAIAYLFYAIACLFSATAAAQNWPEKPIRIISAYPPGGAADLLARLVNNRMKELLGQPVVVENRGGAGGQIGAQYVASTPPDGYTIMFGTIGIHAAYGIYNKLPYDPAKDLQPVILLADLPNILVVHPSVPAQNVQELIRYARDNPGKLSFASSRAGTMATTDGQFSGSATGWVSRSRSSQKPLWNTSRYSQISSGRKPNRNVEIANARSLKQ